MSRVLSHDPAVNREGFQRAHEVADRLDTQRFKYLRIALILVGVIFIAGLYLLMILWPAGWTWHTGHSDYSSTMLVGVYATLGVFLLIAARNPLDHLSLIWFTIWSSGVHAGIMAVQALVNPQSHGHLLGDVPALFIVAAALAVLTPRGAKARLSQRAA
jgi:Family of unknown function (DUF6632)